MVYMGSYGNMFFFIVFPGLSCEIFSFSKMDNEGESSSNDQDVMEAVVNSLSEETDDLEECVDQGVEECSLTKRFPCGLCSMICKSKSGLTLHTRAKHREKTAVTKLVSPINPNVVEEIVKQATQSVVKSKLYGESMTKLIQEADLKPSELLVNYLATLYNEYCEKLDRDKLLKNFYKLMPERWKMFNQ